jgi:hypothetical protein
LFYRWDILKEGGRFVQSFAGIYRYQSITIQAGADTVVVGRAAFAGGKIKENIDTLRAAAKAD